MYVRRRSMEDPHCSQATREGIPKLASITAAVTTISALVTLGMYISEKKQIGKCCTDFVMHYAIETMKYSAISTASTIPLAAVVQGVMRCLGRYQEPSAYLVHHTIGGIFNGIACTLFCLPMLCCKLYPVCKRKCDRPRISHDLDPVVVFHPNDVQQIWAAGHPADEPITIRVHSNPQIELTIPAEPTANPQNESAAAANNNQLIGSELVKSDS